MDPRREYKLHMPCVESLLLMRKYEHTNIEKKNLQPVACQMR